MEARRSRAEALTQAVHDNLRNLGVDALDVVNLRIMFDAHGPAEGSIEAPLTALAELQRQGLVRHIGLSNVTPKQVDEGRAHRDIVCVQNQYNLAHRDDDALIDELAATGIAYVPFFPLGGFTPAPVLGAVRCRGDGSARRRCRWRSPGCCSARPTSCSSPALVGRAPA